MGRGNGAGSRELVGVSLMYCGNGGGSNQNPIQVSDGKAVSVYTRPPEARGARSSAVRASRLAAPSRLEEPAHSAARAGSWYIQAGPIERYPPPQPGVPPSLNFPLYKRR